MSEQGTSEREQQESTPEESTEPHANQRLDILRELDPDGLALGGTFEAVCVAAGRVLNEHPRHVPFALFYLRDQRSSLPCLVARSGFGETGEVPTSSTPEAQVVAWRLDQVLSTGRAEVIDSLTPDDIKSLSLTYGFEEFPLSSCEQAHPQAIVLPLGRVGHFSASGALVCGMSQNTRLDANHRSFLELVAAQVTAGLRNVRLTLDELNHAEAAEASLFSFFMQVPVPICVLRGDQLVFESANLPMCQMLGRDTLVGRTFDEAFPELHDQGASGRRFSEILQGVMRTGTSFEHRELPATIMRNGKAEQAYFNAVFAPITSANGRIERVIAVGVEITSEVVARVNAEGAQKELETTSAALQAAAALRDDFLTVASHELRTPLTTLGLQIDGLLLALHQAPSANAPVPKLIEKANKLRSQADRLETLIEGMLDVFSLGSNDLNLQKTELDLADAARSVVSRLALEFRSIHIELRSEPSVGMWDRMRIEQVITALVSNALKFGAGRPIEVGVGGSSTTARVWVKDRGIGIDPSDQKRIFERFVRAAPSSQYAGFGLGLWLVQEILKAMGGRVAVQSQPGMGSTFTVELPRFT